MSRSLSVFAEIALGHCRLAALTLAAAMSLPAAAQTDGGAVSVADTLAGRPLQEIQSQTCEIPSERTASPSAPTVFSIASTEIPIASPGFSIASPGLGTYLPFHAGLNVELSMSMIAGFGHRRVRGVAFGQNASLAYVVPLGSNFALALGLYANHLSWGRGERSNVGVSAALAYAVSERLTLHAYASKHLGGSGNRLDPFLLFPEYEGDRVGFGADLKIGKSFSMQVDVEAVRHPDGPGYVPWSMHGGRGGRNHFPMYPYGW